MKHVNTLICCYMCVITGQSYRVTFPAIDIRWHCVLQKIQHWADIWLVQTLRCVSVDAWTESSAKAYQSLLAVISLRAGWFGSWLNKWGKIQTFTALWTLSPEAWSQQSHVTWALCILRFKPPALTVILSAHCPYYIIIWTLMYFLVFTVAFTSIL